MQLKQHSVLPGFGLGLGYSLFWLCLIVLLPLAALVLKSGCTGCWMWDLARMPVRYARITHRRTCRY